MFGFDEKKKKIFTICSIAYALLILLVVVIINFEEFAAFYARINKVLSILSPIAIGGVVAYFCVTLVRFFQNGLYKGVKSPRSRRALSIISAYVFIVLVASLFFVLIIPQMAQSVSELITNLSTGTYWDPVFNTLDRFLDTMSDLLGEEVVESIFGEGAFEIIINQGALPDVSESTPETVSSSRALLNRLISDLFKNTREVLAQVTSLATEYAGKVLNGAKNVFLGILLSIYFVLSKEKLFAQTNRILTAVFTKKKAEAIIDWFRIADKTMGGFIVGKLTDAMLIIVVCSVVFSIAKIPYAVLISVIIGVCNIIPFFGPFIGAIPAGFIVFIANPQKLLLYIILIIVIQQIDGNIIEPKIVGDRTGLSSLGVLVAVTIMSGFFGIPGMFLGVPIFAIICSIIKINIKKRLALKNMPTDLKEYYSPNSLTQPDEERETLSSRVFRFVGKAFITCEKFIVKKIKGVFKKQEKNSSAENDSHKDENDQEK